MSLQLEGVRAFSTDGGDALANALAYEFGFVQRLTCFIYVRCNVKDKLADCNIPSELAHKTLNDVLAGSWAVCLWRALLMPLESQTSRASLRPFCRHGQALAYPVQLI